MDLGEPTLIQKIILHPASDAFANIGDGFGFPSQYKIIVSNDPQFADATTTTVFNSDGKDVSNPGIRPQIVDHLGVRGRYVRVTATKLATRQNDFIFALAELAVFNPRGVNVALHAPVSSLDSIESPVRWSRINLVDDIFPGKGSDTDTANASMRTSLLEKKSALIAKRVTPELLRSLEKAKQERQSIEAEAGKLPPPQMVYAGTIHRGKGAFSGTGASDGKPRQIFVLGRGQVNQPLREAFPVGFRHLKPRHLFREDSLENKKQP